MRGGNLHPAIGEILNAEGERRKVIFSACVKLVFQGDSLAIYRVISELPISFDSADLYEELPKEDRDRLIALCMKASNSQRTKECIAKMRRKNDTEHIEIFKRYL